jgi:uncharacterized repeat protein (TIGR02543 family)
MEQRRSLYIFYPFILVLAVLIFLHADPVEAHADAWSSDDFNSFHLSTAPDDPPEYEGPVTGTIPSLLYDVHDVGEQTVDLPGSTATAVLSGTSPDIDVWYGLHQTFGHVGVPQRWVNVLGNVADPDGIASLRYALNGGLPLSLYVGPDTRRLASAGDFNVEIAYTDLFSGLNTVVVTATDQLSNRTVATVTVEYESGNVWPVPYAVDWSSVGKIQDAAQIVDGLWTLGADGIRPALVAYDRVVALGDMTWDDFEVTVPITIHAIDPAGYNWPSVAPGWGIVTRWGGHTNSPVYCVQPHCGWLPSGATAWYEYKKDGSHILKLEGNSGVLNTDPSVTLNLGTRYNLKMRVETVPGVGGLFSVKVWEDGQAEPSAWNLTGQQSLSDPQNGSFLLVAHHVDMTFGDVTVVPVNDTTAPVISNIQVVPEETTATVIWTTDEPATSSVAYGQSVAYEKGSVGNGTLATAHTVVLTGLISDTLYHYQVTSADWSGNIAHSTDLTFTTAFSGGSGLSNIVSDDFNACSLNMALWTWVNPLGDGTLAMTGTHTQDAWLSIAVPAGTAHDLWTTGALAPRVMQSANDVDFETKVKFESAVTQKYQMQGVMVEEDGDSFLRFEFYSDGVTTRVFVASFSEGAVTIRKDSTISGGAPLYMRVRRTGNLWTQFYSTDGQNWTTSVTFSHPFTVTAVGVYAGNDGTTSNNAPAHTGLIDYFFNVASPVVPEDGGQSTLTTDVSGSGTVTKDPDKSTYLCGETVVLTATADPGWSFTGWSGDLVVTVNPATLVMTRSQVITATFIQDEYVLAVNANGDGTVAVEPNQATYIYGEMVTLTATAEAGWTFTDWSGDLSSTDNPATFAIVGNTSISATFAQDEYTLTVDTDGDGSVTVEPNQATHLYGEMVTLTATAEAGWTFTGWSGDLSSTDNPATFAIVGNTSISATFAQDEYTLTVDTDGDGSVTVEPDQATYLYGEMVTLTATAEAGWTFTDWSGDLSSADNPATFAIVGNISISATFAQNHYALTANVVGHGSVTVDPAGPYTYGQVVTLTAMADPGWSFDGWSGDFVGSAQSVTTTMTCNKAVTATFVLEAEEHQVFLPIVMQGSTNQAGPTTRQVTQPMYEERGAPGRRRLIRNPRL